MEVLCGIKFNPNTNEKNEHGGYPLCRLSTRFVQKR